MKRLCIALMCSGLLGCDPPKPAFVPVDLTPSLVEKCKTDWAHNKKLRDSCIAAVESVPNWSRDPNGPKTLGDTCKEQFPDNTTLQLDCLTRGMDDQTNAKIKQAEHDANQ
jgi:hypothetical protein